ncbi:NAD(P)-binding protein [Microstroma glucosiphilum]|uniref:NAD(P)-binding protein n=1 Tax=Pseudomicrostroma glucosiphilum TaxID=1684307 RepID=A0A316TYW8_9BASI|nr:NAD(P)-binding protein [Pseudomicrostroma glucosiphilum]PWN17898.1 NAD(P)-binding protein [Pseudomicrostroma glucosiphilum]
MSSSSLPSSQKQVHLLKRPGRAPLSTEILNVVTAPLPDVSNLASGHVFLKTHFLSLDPSMRPSMDPSKKSYRPPAPLNETFWAGGVGTVIKSNHPEYKEGELVLSSAFGAQEYADMDVAATQRNGFFYKIDPAKGIEPREYLGGLWGTGLAAYLGMKEIAKVKKGDRVLVSGAAGATGGLAIQIARQLGASYIVGVAGGPGKAKYVVEELGADECIDYREANFEKQIASLSDRPEGGMDVYFDNVGGQTLDAALLAMNPNGRIACCGAISGYGGSYEGLKNSFVIVARRLTLQGYIAIGTFWPQDVYQAAIAQLATWLAEKKIATRFHFYEKVGVENFLDALKALFEGKNWGKMLLQVDPEWKGEGSKSAAK